MGTRLRDASSTSTSDGSSDDERRVADAIALARRMVDEAAVVDAADGRAVRRRRDRLRTLIAHPGAADFTVQLTDEVTRIAVPDRAARRFSRLVHSADLSAFSSIDRLLLRIGARIAPLAPRLVMPLVVRRLRSESEGVILPAEDPRFAEHLAARRAAGIRCNINVLGEAIVGDAEAQHRLAMIDERLRRADVDYVSVKISAICPGISPLAFDDTVARVSERLRVLYRTAMSFQPAKFVNLDMEEFRDLDLTVAVFRRVLDEPEFTGLDAGIVMQAYLPDVRATAQGLGEWAVRRRQRGGGRIKIRIVKGANLAMEMVEAELRNWSPAPYGSKTEVDANYKAVLDVLIVPEFDDAVRIGVASHNLFDVAWALGLRRQMVRAGRPDRLEIEMLEGMAPAQSDAVRREAGSVLLYAPVVTHDDFAAAIAYLVRRLDENTSPENFLSHVFDLADDPALFQAEADRFRRALAERTTVAAESHRRQDRSLTMPATSLADPFVNAADTDWTREPNRRWIGDAVAALAARTLTHATTSADQPNGAPVTVDSVDLAVQRSVAARAAWAGTSVAERATLVHRVGDVFEQHRGEVLAVMADEAGKTIAEGDPEVSEAVDFARFYAHEAVRLADVAGVTATPLGTVVITPPWNFPFAIPAGGVLAALAMGNTVILKPAPQTVRTAALIADCCWQAGVSRDVLQFVPAADDDAGRRLITHTDVSAVILTGAFDTAAMFHSWRPDLRLHAETSGKNALVVTATADLDHAIADLVRSAFGHAGQKCSAASLAIVEAPLYDDPAFLERLRDAAATLRVGWPDDLSADVGPLVEPPGDRLERALTTLDAGERWLLPPQCMSDDRRLWSPGIRMDVRPSSWFARTECFGPVLGLIRADDLDHAIRIQNSTDFGLTAGLHALDPIEIERWTDRVQAGNLYVNRGITGAIVQRQPFGGWKRSAVGPTAKAGGPNYLPTLARWTDANDRSPMTDTIASTDPIDTFTVTDSDAAGVPGSADLRGSGGSAGVTSLDQVAVRFEGWMRLHGCVGHDATGLRAERNVFRYRPLIGGVAVRFGTGATARDRALVTRASAATGTRLVVSDAASEPDGAFAERLATAGVSRLRLIGVGSDSGDPTGDNDAFVVHRVAHEHGIPVDDSVPVSAPEIELPRWLHEQAVSVTVHRHGRVGPAHAARSSVSSV